jgi:hypothetical protein
VTPQSNEFEDQLAGCHVAPDEDVRHVPLPSVPRISPRQMRMGARVVHIDIDEDHSEIEPLRLLPHALSIPPTR